MNIDASVRFSVYEFSSDVSVSVLCTNMDPSLTFIVNDRDGCALFSDSHYLIVISGTFSDIAGLKNDRRIACSGTCLCLSLGLRCCISCCLGR